MLRLLHEYVPPVPPGGSEFAVGNAGLDPGTGLDHDLGAEARQFLDGVGRCSNPIFNRVSLARDGNAWVWSFTARDPHAQDMTAPIDDDLTALIDGLDKLKVVLVAGRFDVAAGFTLSGDRRAATLIDADNHHEPEGADESVMTLRLRWIPPTS